MKALIVPYYAATTNNPRGKKHGEKQWQIDHYKAKDARREARKNTGNPSTLSRFSTDKGHRNTQIAKLGWTEAFCRYLDHIVTTKSRMKLLNLNGTVKCGDPNKQLGPTRERYDHRATTKMQATICQEQGKANSHIPKT